MVDTNKVIDGELKDVNGGKASIDPPDRKCDNCAYGANFCKSNKYHHEVDREDRCTMNRSEVVKVGKPACNMWQKSVTA